ncbi:MAG: hypothetical protein KC493_16205 [Bacteriovoracaceae bacterium]|nr:hypothetical protein [Bacteriovoracaceae bacterium]
MLKLMFMLIIVGIVSGCLDRRDNDIVDDIRRDNYDGIQISRRINDQVSPPRKECETRDDNSDIVIPEPAPSNIPKNCNELSAKIKTCEKSYYTGDCNRIMKMPRRGEGYISTHYERKSYLKKYVMQEIQQAAHFTKCSKGGDSALGPLGLGDMGSASGHDIDGHPPGTHSDGKSIDIAYFQKRGSNNHLRPVCPHRINGREAYHCVGEADNIDYERTALFMAKLLESPKLRIIGVDGKIEDKLVREIKRLCRPGLSLHGSKACGRTNLITSEKENTGRGWYHHHHHHFHASFK